MQETVDGVVLCPVRSAPPGSVVEAAGAVGQPVGPRNQRGAVRAVGHRGQRVRVEHVLAGYGVLADPAADLHDRGLVLAGADRELITGRATVMARTFCAVGG